MALRLFLLLLLACLGPYAAASGQAQFTRDAALPAWIVPLALAAPATRTDPVVIRLAESQVFLGKRTSLLVHRVVQVNEKGALSEIGQYRMTFNPAYQKLLVHRIALQRGQQYIDRTGTTKIRLIDREEALESGILGGRVTAQIVLDDVRVGDSLDIVYSIEGTNPVFGDRWSDSFGLDDKAPIAYRRIVVNHPQDRPLQWRQLGDHQRSPVTASTEPAGTRARLVLEARNVEGVQFEPSIPSSFIPLQLIQISEYKSWNEVAQWAARLFSNKRPSPAVQTLANQFAKSGSPTVQASEALHWVQEQVRYLSISVGENSHRPQAPEEVLRRRYGDCKDKTNLYIALLAALGIQGEPVLVASSWPALPGKVLPGPDWFDHVIVRVHLDGKTYLVDPTRTDELGELPVLASAFPGGHVLPATPNSESLLVLAAAQPGLPALEREETWTIEQFDGDAVLELRQRWRGLHAVSARSGWTRASASERKDFLLADLEKHYPGIRLLGEPGIDNLEQGAVFSVTARFSVPAPLTLREGSYELSFHSGIVDGSIGLPDKLSRSFPFALAGGRFHGRYLAHVRWPKHARTNISPSARHIDNAFFAVHSEAVQHGNRLEFVVDYRLKRAEIGKEEVVALQREAKALGEFIGGELRYPKDWASDPELGAASPRELGTMSLIASLREQGELLNNRKWDDKQTALACAHAAFNINADEVPQAQEWSALLGARLAAMRDAPKAQGCAAGLAYLDGDTQRMAQLLRGRALATDQDLPFRAEMLLALGQADAARTSLLNDMGRLRAEGTLAQLDAVRVLALLQRSGGPVPAELVDYIAADVDPTWPRPIASMLLDRLPEDELIRLAEQDDGDLKVARLAEAWYYVGQHRLARQDKTGAIAAFSWHRANGVRMQQETTLALAELRLLTENDPDYRAGMQLDAEKKVDAAQERLHAAAQRGIVEAQFRLGLLYGDTKRDYPKALAWFDKALAHGSAGAGNELAIMYDDGLGVAVDAKRAVELFEIAARRGHKHGAFNLGNRWEYGRAGLQRDPARAFLLYRDAAHLGHADAMAKVAESYSSGYGVAKSYRLSLFWATLGMLNGSMKAQTQLAFLYKWGYGVKQDQAKAVELLQEAAEHKVSSAQVQLGHSYEYGLGVAKNAAQAIKWYQQAASQGNTYAEINGAMLILANKPDRAQADQALRVLQKHVDNGDMERAIDLGRVYKFGLGVSPDVAKANAYYKQAADKGNTQAQVLLADMYYLGAPAERDYAAALALYQKAADANDAHALNNLGDMYEKGCGVEVDFGRANALYVRAANQANAVAFASLGTLYEHGRGTQRAPLQAYLYYRISARLGYAEAHEDANRVRGTIAAEQLAEADLKAAAWKQGDPLPALAAGG